jgi:hypothetical protein
LIFNTFVFKNSGYALTSHHKTFPFQHSPFSFQLFPFPFQLSAFPFKLSTFNFQLFIFFSFFGTKKDYLEKKHKDDDESMTLEEIQEAIADLKKKL